MNNRSEALSREEIVAIAKADDLHIAPFRADGMTYGTPTWIWSVAVDGQLYVRAYNGTSSRWYKAAMSQGSGKIEAAGMEKKVRFEAVDDRTLNDKIDKAYQNKYSRSPYLNSMISDRAKNATVKILPFV